MNTAFLPHRNLLKRKKSVGYFDTIIRVTAIVLFSAITAQVYTPAANVEQSTSMVPLVAPEICSRTISPLAEVIRIIPLAETLVNCNVLCVVAGFGVEVKDGAEMLFTDALIAS